MHFRKSYVRSNQLDVSETNFCFAKSTESEIISLDAGLRMDGIPALDLWDLIVHRFSRKHASDGETRTNLQGERKFMERLLI